MNEQDFGQVKTGEVARLYTLENELLRVAITNYGATMVDLFHKGTQRHVVLGYEDVIGYETNGGQLGATVGRIANRIAGAAYTWNGEEHQLKANNGPNLLHSGAGNIGHRLWDLVDMSESKVVLSHTVRSEEDGFPGDLHVQLEAVLEGERVALNYTYHTTTDSFVNLTNHSYFNLSGTGTIHEHNLQLGAQEYMPFGDHQIPLREAVSLEGTAFDFRKPQSLGAMLDAHASVLVPYKGYDHDFVVKALDDVESLGDGVDPIAVLSVDDLVLRMYSDAPHMQVYTGNWLDAKGREPYVAHSGIAIEPQFVPDDIHSVQDSLTVANQTYTRRIVYELLEQ